MNDLKSVSKIVKAILLDDKQARNSDSFLYLKVLRIYGERNGIDLDSMSVPCFLMNLQRYKFPPFESVRRTRQLVQAQFPELGACEKVEAVRAENETEYREYARSVLS